MEEDKEIEEKAPCRKLEGRKIHELVGDAN